MKLIFVSIFILFFSVTATAQGPSQWPLRAIEVGSTISILPEILPSHEFEKGSTYQNGKRVVAGGPNWDPTIPYCRVDHSTIAFPHYYISEDHRFKITAISGQYWNNSIELHVDNPYFETEFSVYRVDKTSDIFFVKCFSYKEERFGEITLGELFEAFGHRLSGHDLKLKSPGKYSSAPISQNFVLEKKHLLENMRLTIQEDLVLTKPEEVRDFFRITIQDGKIIEKFEDLDFEKNLCRFFALYDEDKHGEKPESITLPKNLETGFKEVTIQYGKGKTGMLTPPWFVFTGFISNHPGEIPIRFSCDIMESSSYVRERDIRPVIKGLIGLTYLVIINQ